MRRLICCLSVYLAVWGFVCPTESSAGYADGLAIFNLRATNLEAMDYNGEILFALLSSLEKHKQIEKNIAEFHNPFGEDDSAREELKLLANKNNTEASGGGE